jgi:hypothetical protein
MFEDAPHGSGHGGPDRRSWRAAARRFGRNPYEHDAKSASKMGSSTALRLVCYGRSHPSTAGAFNATTPYSRSRGVIAAAISLGVIAREYSTSV